MERERTQKEVIEDLQRKTGVKVIAQEWNGTIDTESIYVKCRYNPDGFKKIKKANSDLDDALEHYDDQPNRKLDRLGYLRYVDGTGYFLDTCEAMLSSAIEKLKPLLEAIDMPIEHMLITNSSIKRLQAEWDKAL
jgi:hypothetical protein